VVSSENQAPQKDVRTLGELQEQYTGAGSWRVLTCTTYMPAGPCTLAVQNSARIWFHATELPSADLTFGDFVGSIRV